MNSYISLASIVVFLFCLESQATENPINHRKETDSLPLSQLSPLTSEEKEAFESLIYNDGVQMNIEVPSMGEDKSYVSEYKDCSKPGECTIRKGPISHPHGSFYGMRDYRLDKITYEDSKRNPQWVDEGFQMTFLYKEHQYSYESYLEHKCYADVLLPIKQIREVLEKFKAGEKDFTLSFLSKGLRQF